MKVPWQPFVSAGAALLLALAPLMAVYPVRVSGASMLPNYRPGQRVWVLRAWAAGDPQRHEVWLVQAPGGPSLKRVLGLPGETLAQQGRGLICQGLPLEEAVVTVPEDTEGGPWETKGGFWLMGDNRPQSCDSRAWGPLSRDAFVGRVLGGKP